jgi:hypothetical protein
MNPPMMRNLFGFVIERACSVLGCRYTAQVLGLPGGLSLGNGSLSISTIMEPQLNDSSEPRYHPSSDLVYVNYLFSALRRHTRGKEEGEV